MASEPLSEALSEYRRAINERVSRWIGRQHPQGFYDMMRYQLEPDDTVPASTPFELPGQACSLLCILTYRAVTGQPVPSPGLNAAIGAAAAIELLTGWFQIHRDIEEEIPIERGRPSLSSRWGYAQAINTGDGMFPLAARAMLEAVDDPTLALTLIRELTDTSLSYMEGQYRELTFNTHGRAGSERSNVTSQERLEIIELTTGALMGYSAWAGGIIGGAGDGTQQDLRHFGAELGIAWGIQHSITGAPSRRETEVTGTAREAAPTLSPDASRQHVDRAVIALRRANLGLVNEGQLETVARELIDG